MPATSGTAVLTLPSDTEILMVREFDAPRELVFKAYTTPELVRRWWAGKRGNVTIAEIDLRVGGQWRYVMVADGGFEVAFHGEYHEIVPNEKLVNTEIFEGAPEARRGARDLHVRGPRRRPHAAAHADAAWTARRSAT